MPSTINSNSYEYDNPCSEMPNNEYISTASLEDIAEAVERIRRRYVESRVQWYTSPKIIYEELEFTVGDNKIAKSKFKSPSSGCRDEQSTEALPVGRWELPDNGRARWREYGTALHDYTQLSFTYTDEEDSGGDTDSDRPF